MKQFIVPAGGDAWSGDRRELRTVDLREISVVQAWPAYGETTVSARSRGAGGLTAIQRARMLEVLR